MKGEWMRTTLRRADARLTEIRTGTDGSEAVPNAGGLVTCRSTDHADEVAAFLAKVTGTLPDVVHHKMPNADDVIEAFRVGSGRWLVSVRMVSEGVDIERLRVGVYATNIITLMNMRQFVGRFVRGTGESIVFIPADAVLLDYAARITEEVEYALKEQARAIVEETIPETREEREASLFRFLGASFAEHVTIRNGSEIPADVLIQARKLVETKRGRAMESVATLIAELMVEQGWYRGAIRGSDVAAAPETPEPPYEIEAKVRAKRQQFVNLVSRELAWIAGTDPKGGDMRRVVNTKLMMISGVYAGDADIDTLRHQVRLLSQWVVGIERARAVGNDAEWAAAWEDGLYDDGCRAQA
jgi:superfamily II DNA or RNA helicase